MNKLKGQGSTWRKQNVEEKKNKVAGGYIQLDVYKILKHTK